MGSRGGTTVYRRDDERSSHPSQETAPTNSSAGVNAATDQTTSPRLFEPGACESLVAFSLCFCFERTLGTAVFCSRPFFVLTRAVLAGRAPEWGNRGRTFLAKG